MNRTVTIVLAVALACAFLAIIAFLPRLAGFHVPPDTLPH